MSRRAAQELRCGFYLNLGIHIATLVLNYIAQEMSSPQVVGNVVGAHNPAPDPSIARAPGAGLGGARPPALQEASQIRRMPIEGAVRASDRRAQFAGVAAYVEAPAPELGGSDRSHIAARPCPDDQNIKAGVRHPSLRSVRLRRVPGCS